MYLDQQALFTDYYELTMAQGYFLSGRHQETSSFDYFFRKNPFDGGYVVFAGLGILLETIESFSFDDASLDYLRREGFDKSFINYLKNFQFQGDIFSASEGEIIFPNEPILRVDGTLIEAQIIETLILNILNYQSLIATKATRMRYAAGEEAILLDFGLRRAQGLGGIHATRAAIIGGFDGTSNMYSANRFSLQAGGTMAHSWVQSFDNELSSFQAYAQHFPDSTVLLVDTFDTLGSGVPNAIKVAKELKKSGHQLNGIRLDSGDLAYFSQQSRKMLDDAGFPDVKIVVSNQLDEQVIKSLKSQNAPIDTFGVGTRLVTGNESPALDGVYKLSSCNDIPKLKISENIEKTTLPGRKHILRYKNDNDEFYADAISSLNGKKPEVMHHPSFPDKKISLSGLEPEPLLKQVCKNGKVYVNLPPAEKIAEFRKNQFSKLSDYYKRFENPHIYKVGISSDLLKKRDEIIKMFK